MPYEACLLPGSKGRFNEATHQAPAGWATCRRRAGAREHVHTVGSSNLQSKHLHRGAAHLRRRCATSGPRCSQGRDWGSQMQAYCKQGWGPVSSAAWEPCSIVSHCSHPLRPSAPRQWIDGALPIKQSLTWVLHWVHQHARPSEAPDSPCCSMARCINSLVKAAHRSLGHPSKAARWPTRLNCGMRPVGCRPRRSALSRAPHQPSLSPSDWCHCFSLNRCVPSRSSDRPPSAADQCGASSGSRQQPR